MRHFYTTCCCLFLTSGQFALKVEVSRHYTHNMLDITNHPFYIGLIMMVKESFMQLCWHFFINPGKRPKVQQEVKAQVKNSAKQHMAAGAFGRITRVLEPCKLPSTQSQMRFLP